MCFYNKTDLNFNSSMLGCSYFCQLRVLKYPFRAFPESWTTNLHTSIVSYCIFFRVCTPKKVDEPEKKNTFLSVLRLVSQTLGEFLD